MKNRTLQLMLLFGGLLAALPAGAAIVRSGVFFGPGYGPWGYGYVPYYAAPYVAHLNAGQVKIDTKLFGNDAQVFIDGAFAGTAKQMKSTWLQQGTYRFELRAQGRETFDSNVYVVNGKTVQLRPDWPAAAGK